jgi:hypothetical protein
MQFYRMTEKAVLEYNAAIKGGASIYSTRPPGRRIKGEDVAILVRRGALLRAFDQTSPIGESHGMSRWVHICPVTGKEWICEERLWPEDD